MLFLKFEIEIQKTSHFFVFIDAFPNVCWRGFSVSLEFIVAFSTVCWLCFSMLIFQFLCFMAFKASVCHFCEMQR